VHVVHVVPAVSVGHVVPVVHFRSSGRRSARMNLVECVRAYRSSRGRCRTGVIITTRQRQWCLSEVK